METKGSLHIIGILEWKLRKKTSEFVSRKQEKKSEIQTQMEDDKMLLFFFFSNGVTLTTKYFQMVFFILYLRQGNDVVRWHG